MDLHLHIEELKKTGLTILPGVYSRDQCESAKVRTQAVQQKIRDQDPAHYNLFCRTGTPFAYDRTLLEFVYHDQIDQVLKSVLDEDYVLIVSNTNDLSAVSDDFSDRSAQGGSQSKKFKGGLWHHDSKYVAGKRLEAGFNYAVIIMLDDFKVTNGATQVYLASRDERGRPDPHGAYEARTIEGTAGSVAILDAGLWHRSGTPSTESRWAVLNQYGPWFLKPYFRYPEMLGEEFGRSVSPPLRRLLHYCSTPPLNERERVNTLIKQTN